MMGARNKWYIKGFKIQTKVKILFRHESSAVHEDVWRGGDRVFTYNAYHNEEYNKNFAQDSFCSHVTITNSWHGNQQEVHAFPVRQQLRIIKVQPRVASILNLQNIQRYKYYHPSSKGFFLSIHLLMTMRQVRIEFWM